MGTALLEIGGRTLIPHFTLKWFLELRCGMLKKHCQGLEAKNKILRSYNYMYARHTPLLEGAIE